MGNDFRKRVVNIIEGNFFERHYSSLTKKNMLVLLTSKLLKQTFLKRKSVTHSHIIYKYNFNYSLLVR